MFAKEEDVDRIIDLKEVMRLVVYKRSSIYRMIEDGSFPKQIKLGPRRVGWSLKAVKEWQEARQQLE
jgi:prophage regulatory protein